MSQHRQSPVATRPILNLTAGEKAHPLSDSIPEESATASKDNKDAAPTPESGRWSWFKLDMTKTEWDILVASTCLKLLLFPA